MNNSLYKKIEELYSSHDKYARREANRLIYEDNNRIFKEWANGNDPYGLGSRENLLNNTRLYSDEFNVNDIKLEYNTITGVINIDCVKLGEKLVMDGYRPAILNLASRHNPCGGYDHGMSAQEESLCRASTLSQSLYQFLNPNSRDKRVQDRINAAGVGFKGEAYPLDISFGAIYSPGVCFFREGPRAYFKPLAKGYIADVITCAALNFNTYTKYDNKELIYSNYDGGFNEKGIIVMKNKIRTILRLAISNGNDSIILGAFGCGVFMLRPNEVARLFNEVIGEDEFRHKLKLIVFAIMAGPNDKDKYKPFYDLFGTYSI